MTIKMVDAIGGELLDELWKMYGDAFRDLNALAVQRHLMYRTEFDEVMADRRVGKYLHLDDAGTIDGLATYTNDLDAVPLISPAYFERRWPVHYHQRRIWYVGFVAVHADAPVSVFPALIAAMHETSGRDALTALDVCTRTEQVRHLPRAVKALLGRLDGPVRMTRLDEQSFWLYEFPERQP